MFSVKILDVKAFMNHLLRLETFDQFLLCEASIKTGITYHLEGKLNLNFFNSDELEIMNQRQYTYWKEQKDLAFSIIRGHKTPLAFKFIFMLAPSNVEKLVLLNHLALTASDISGLFLNLHFDSNGLICTSGSSLKMFTMDKTVEQVWDTNLLNFFKKNQLLFE